MGRPALIVATEGAIHPVKNDKRRDSMRLIGLITVLHILCCGVPIILLSGVSLAFLVPN